MITVSKLIRGILNGKYSKLDAKVLISKHYKGENFNLFYSDFKRKVESYLAELMFDFTNNDFLKIIEDINEYNKTGNNSSWAYKELIIPKIYLRVGSDEWEKVKHFYKKIGMYDCLFNTQGFNKTPLKDIEYKEFVFLNDLVVNYISHNGYGFILGFKNTTLMKLERYPLLLEISNSFESNCSNTKQKPEPNEKLITFKNSETIEKIHSELKGYFPNKEAELLKAFKGEQLGEILLFPHNQNKFVEVFRRLKYNGFLLNTDTETKNWICTTFQFVKKGFAEPQPFNESSVWDNLNKGKGEPTKKERICITEWLPYKSPLQLTRETENEKL